jgi:hypothetical protein
MAKKENLDFPTFCFTLLNVEGYGLPSLVDADLLLFLSFSFSCAAVPKFHFPNIYIYIRSVYMHIYAKKIDKYTHMHS